MATKKLSGPNAATEDPELATVARQVIDANRYLVLATADQHGVPWVSPWYAHAGYREPPLRRTAPRRAAPGAGVRAARVCSGLTSA